MYNAFHALLEEVTLNRLGRNKKKKGGDNPPKERPKYDTSAAIKSCATSQTETAQTAQPGLGVVGTVKIPPSMWAGLTPPNYQWAADAGTAQVHSQDPSPLACAAAGSGWSATQISSQVVTSCEHDLGR